VPLEGCHYADALLTAPHGAMPSARQVVEIDVERSMTSCGYGVPVMEQVRERERSDRGLRFKPRAEPKR
jgi:hypothetical protein